MDPNEILEGKTYLVECKDGPHVLKLHHKVTYPVVGKNVFWYFLFEREDGNGYVHVKTHRRVLRLEEDLFKGE